MAQTTLKLHTVQSNGSTWVDPTDPDFSVRFRTNSTPKNLNGVRVTNQISEIIINDVFPITVGSDTAQDALSVRLRCSGSIESIDRLKVIIANLAAQVDSWTGEDVLLGFQPTTAPVNGTV